jgi:hypothetical protein
VADVDQNPEAIKGVLNAADLRREFLKGIPADEKKAVKAFVGQNQESALKTKPKVRTDLFTPCLTAPMWYPCIFITGASA